MSALRDADRSVNKTAEKTAEKVADKGVDKGVQPLSIRRNMLWNSTGSLVNLGCQWVITVLIVRLSDGYDAAGVYSLAMSVYGIFSQLAQYRTYTYQVSDVRGENSAGEYLVFRAITCLAALVCTMGYAAVTCRPGALLAILLYSLYKMASLVVDVLHASDQQAHRMDYIGKSLAMQGVSSVALFTAIFWITRSLELALLAMTAGVVAIGVLYDLPRTLRLTPIVPKISLEKARHLLVYCAPVVLAGIACSAAPSVPRQYLSHVMGDSALGIYASVAAPVAIIQMGASYIYNPLIGYFSESYARRDEREFRRLLVLTFCGIAAVGVACSVGLALLGGPLLALVYGEGIVEHLYLLQPLVLCAVVTGVMWFANDLLISLRGFRATFVGSVVSLVTSLAVMVPAVGAFGMNGVTVANVASCVTSAAFMLWSLRALTRLRFGGAGGAAADGNGGVGDAR